MLGKTVCRIELDAGIVYLIAFGNAENGFLMLWVMVGNNRYTSNVIVR